MPKKKLKSASSSVLYYPTIEIQDVSWLLSAALFWDRVYTIAPDGVEPYHRPESMYLADQGVLVPCPVRSDHKEVKRASGRIADLIHEAEFRSLLGQDHWLRGQSQRHPVHGSKIEGSLRLELEKAGWAHPTRDGFFDMPSGLAAAYMLLLAVEVARQKECSLATDDPKSFRTAEAARLRDGVRFRDFDELQDRAPATATEFVNACLSEMTLSWFRVDPGSDPKKIIAFRQKHRVELGRLRDAILRTNSEVLSEGALTHDDLRRKAKKYVHGQILPGTDELRKALSGEGIALLPSILKATLYSTMPAGLGVLAGQTWALVAAPLCGIAVAGITHLARRRRELLQSPWSYLYLSEEKFAAPP